MTARRVLRGALIAVAVVALAASAVLSFFLYTAPGRDSLRKLLVARLGDQITGRITIGRLEGTLPNEVVLRDVALTDSAGSLVFGANRIAARVNVVQLFSKRIDISRMALDTATLVLRHRRGGAWNVARVFARDDRDAGASGGRGFGHWVRIANARVTSANVLVRVPWGTDGDALATRGDSARAAAERERALVERTPDGFEQVMRFRNIDAQFPRVIVAHPDTARILVEVARASMIAEPFRPPAADIRDLGGTLVVTSDSLRFVGWRVSLPESRMAVDVRYAPTTGGLRGRMRADPVRFRDLQWLHPSLPAEGRGAVTITAARDSGGPLDLRATEIVAEVGQATATGAVRMAVGDTVRLTHADVRIARLDTDVARQLAPGLQLPLEGVLDARARVDSAAGGFMTDATASFVDRGGGTSRVTARGLLRVGDSLGARDLRLELSPLQSRIIRDLAPNVRIHGVVSGTARVSGSARSGWRVVADLSHVDRGARSRAIGLAASEQRSGAVSFDGRVAPLSLDAVSRIAPELGLYGSASGPIRVALTGDSVAFRTTLRVANGTIAAAGGVGWGARDLSYDVRAEPRDFDPRAVSTRAPEGSLNGTITVRGHGTDVRTARAELSLAVYDARVERIAVDSFRLAARVADGMATVDTLAARRGTARLAAAGSIGLDEARVGELRYAAEADSLGSPSTAAATRTVDGDGASTTAPEWYVRGASANGTARGNIKSLRVAGRASVGELAGSRVAARGAAADYVVGLGRDDTLAVATAADSVRAGRLAYEEAQVRLEGTRRQLSVSTQVRQNAQVGLLANADISLDSAARGEFAREGVVTLRDLAFRLPSGEWRTPQAASITWRDGSLIVDSLVVRGDETRSLRVAGDLPATGNGALDLRLERLSLADVAALRQTTTRADGELSATLHVTGTASAPRAEGTASLVKLVVRGDSLPDVRSVLAYGDERLTLRASVGTDSAPALVDASAELPINLALTGVSGARLSRGAPIVIDARVDSLPLTALPRRAALEVERGWARGQLRVRGTIEDPAVRGQLDVRDGAAFVPVAGITVREVAATGRITNDSLVIDSLVARSNGSVRASGVLLRSRGGAGRVSATLSARDAAVLGGNQGDMHADADLELSGTTDSLNVTGRAEVLHGFIERKGPGEQALRVAAMGDPELFAIIDTSATVRRPEAREVVRQPRTLHADVAVRINPSVWYRSAPNAKVEVFTPRDLRVRGDVLADDVAAGGVVLTRGGVYVFRLRPFAIVRGGATLAGASHVSPLIQATGEHDVWIVGRGMLPVRFIASGFPSAVQFSLGDPAVFPAAPPDVGSYLSLGRPPVSLLQQEGSSLSGLSTSGGRFTGELGALVRRQQVSPALGAVLYQLAKGARDAVGIKLFTVSPTDLPPELAESKLAGVRGTTVDGGYLFGSRTYVGARVRLSAVSPGVVVVHSFSSSLHLRGAYEPLFQLGEPPALGPAQQGTLRRALGAFLTKDWWF